jgi:hypothetical protein
MTPDRAYKARLAQVRANDAVHEEMMQQIAALAGVSRDTLRVGVMLPNNLIDRVVAKHGPFPKGGAA